MQKNGGRLGESGSTTHLFYNCGVIHVDKKKSSEDEIFEIAINSGAKDCFHLESIHEIISNKEDFYKIKSVFEKKLDNFEYSGIEWRAFSYLNLNKEQNEKIIGILETLEELDDVQTIYTNANLGNIKL
jgi:transcriptional/translational regulatory protein YebC/TACO1